MLTFLSKKTKTEFLNPEGEFKDWKDAWPEIEALGNRIDSAREARDRCAEGTWSHGHWSTIADTLFRKWQLMITLYQSGLRQRGPERGFTINYDWFEGSDEITGLIPFPRFLDINNWFSQSDLSYSWAKAQEEKLQKARQGLA